MRYLDPKNDIPFKRVFAQRKDLLISLLNALLPLGPDQQIVSLEYLPNDVLPISGDGKNTIADVRCTDQNDRQFIVEMQMLWTKSFAHRVVFEASRAYVNQLKAGGDYEDLKPVYLLSLLNETFQPKESNFFHDYQICEKASGHAIEGLRWFLVELPKFRPDTPSQKKYFKFWLRYFTEITSTTQEVSADLLEVPEIRDAVKSLEVAAYSSGELAAYNQYWAQVSRDRTLFRERYEDGKAEGRAEGKAEGLAEGEAKGKAEGEIKGEAETNRKTARAMKKKGLSAELIAEITGLAFAEIEKL
jgi:predicted transposase/invertase (TIGR01784 family)